jgi:pyruvate, water dikinase
VCTHGTEYRQERLEGALLAKFREAMTAPMIDALARKLFDGFSIGSNDLTQLVLGVDRDSELVAPEFDELNPTVLSAIAAIIEGARRVGRKVGICGQAPSDYPEIVRFRVDKGITSISLNPDAIVRGREAVAAAETHVGHAAMVKARLG